VKTIILIAGVGFVIIFYPDLIQTWKTINSNKKGRNDLPFNISIKTDTSELNENLEDKLNSLGLPFTIKVKNTNKLLGTVIALIYKGTNWMLDTRLEDPRFKGMDSLSKEVWIMCEEALKKKK